MKPERSLGEACEEVENIIREHKHCKLQCEDLKMVCRRLAAAQSLETRDKIAEQCHHLFRGDPLKTSAGETTDEWFERQEKLGRTAVKVLIDNIEANLRAITTLGQSEIDVLMRVNRLVVKQCLEDCGVE